MRARPPAQRTGGTKALWAALALLAAVASPAAAGENEATVALRTLKGEEVRVFRQGDRVRLPGIQGRAVLINFWATWCDPCREEVPDLVSLFEKYRARGLTVVGISFDTSLDKVHDFVKDHRVSYPIWIGNKTLVRKWMVRGLPLSYLVDGEGRIRKRYLGARKGATFEKDLLELLPPAGKDRDGTK